MPNDIKYTELPNETIIHPNSVKGAQWIAKHVTTNVTDIHYAGEEGKTRAKGLIADMRGDGLEVNQRLEGESEEDTGEEDAEGNRVGLGSIECRYCGSLACNFDCDESQAGGFDNNDNPVTGE